jgi:hypothetical protein
LTGRYDQLLPAGGIPVNERSFTRLRRLETKDVPAAVRRGAVPA